MEKILEEIKAALKETYLDIADNYDISDLHSDGDRVACTAGAFRDMAVEKIENIFHSHMEGSNGAEDGSLEYGEGYSVIDGVLCEIGSDDTEEKLKKVVADIRSYFNKHLPQYEVMKIRRKSFHKDDGHLYMAAAKRKDGVYAVWTSWNEQMRTLNHGHYNLVDLDVCDRIMDEFYNGND